MWPRQLPVLARCARCVWSAATATALVGGSDVSSQQVQGQVLPGVIDAIGLGAFSLLFLWSALYVDRSVIIGRANLIECAKGAIGFDSVWNMSLQPEALL